MTVIAVASQKGGISKTTLTDALSGMPSNADALYNAGQRAAHAADAPDTQPPDQSETSASEIPDPGLADDPPLPPSEVPDDHTSKVPESQTP